jgi:hypothetical protein
VSGQAQSEATSPHLLTDSCIIEKCRRVLNQYSVDSTVYSRRKDEAQLLEVWLASGEVIESDDLQRASVTRD